MKDLHSLFKIEEIKSHRPYYEIFIEMDSNDGDYIKNSFIYSPEEFKKLPDILLYALMYLGHGYYGKFSHSGPFDYYYGHHFRKNKHGLSFLGDIMSNYNLMCFSDYGECHSYTEIEIGYIDEFNCRHTVILPDIDSLFNTEDDMIQGIKGEYENYKKNNG